MERVWALLGATQCATWLSGIVGRVLLGAVVPGPGEQAAPAPVPAPARPVAAAGGGGKHSRRNSRKKASRRSALSRALAEAGAERQAGSPGSPPAPIAGDGPAIPSVESPSCSTVGQSPAMPALAAASRRSKGHCHSGREQELSAPASSEDGHCQPASEPAASAPERQPVGAAPQGRPPTPPMPAPAARLEQPPKSAIGAAAENSTLTVAVPARRGADKCCEEGEEEKAAAVAAKLMAPRVCTPPPQLVVWRAPSVHSSPSASGAPSSACLPATPCSFSGHSVEGSAGSSTRASACAGDTSRPVEAPDRQAAAPAHAQPAGLALDRLRLRASPFLTGAGPAAHKPPSSPGGAALDPAALSLDLAALASKDSLPSSASQSWLRRPWSPRMHYGMRYKFDGSEALSSAPSLAASSCAGDLDWDTSSQQSMPVVPRHGSWTWPRPGSLGDSPPPAPRQQHGGSTRASAPSPAARLQRRQRRGTAPGAAPGLLAVAQPPQLPSECPDDGPDLERFLQASTPRVAPLPGHSASDLTLADLWRCYEAPSMLGQECELLGGPAGPCTAYFVPYLSAVQLFTSPGSQAAAAALAGQQTALSYPAGLDSWPQEMLPLLRWADSSHIGERVPLADQVEELAAGSVGTAISATRVADLHPYSWYAVAWYPLYRIPEALLDARFLTFHSMAPLWEAAAVAKQASGPASPTGVDSLPGTPCGSQAAGTASCPSSVGSCSEGREPEEAAPPPPPAAAGRPAPAVDLPPVGLTWYSSQRSGRWTETLVAAPLSGGAAALPVAGGSCVGCWRGQALHARPYPVSKGGPLSWEIELEELEEGAQRLALGLGLMHRSDGSGGWEPAPVRCPDWDFFCSRGAGTFA